MRGQDDAGRSWMSFPDDGGGPIPEPVFYCSCRLVIRRMAWRLTSFVSLRLSAALSVSAPISGHALLVSVRPGLCGGGR